MKYCRTTLMLMILSFCAFAFAQDASVPPADIPVADFLTQIIQAVKGFGGLSWMLKVASVCLVIVSSMKVSALKPLWDKLGTAQKWVAPVLALIAGLLSQGTSISWASALAYLGAGAAAPYIHDLLDLIKVIPGIGSFWVGIINMIENIPLIGSKS